MKHQVFELESIEHAPTATVGHVLVAVDEPFETVSEAREKIQEMKRISPRKDYTILTIY